MSAVATHFVHVRDAAVHPAAWPTLPVFICDPLQLSCAVCCLLSEVYSDMDKAAHRAATPSEHHVPLLPSQASCGDPNQTESSQRWSRSLERHRDSSVRSWTFQCDMIGVRQVASPPDQDVLGGHSRLAQPPRLHVTAEPLRLTMLVAAFPHIPSERSTVPTQACSHQCTPGVSVCTRCVPFSCMNALVASREVRAAVILLDLFVRENQRVCLQAWHMRVQKSTGLHKIGVRRKGDPAAWR
jgi:hypothetical protein